jgi:hypothetical protein
MIPPLFYRPITPRRISRFRFSHAWLNNYQNRLAIDGQISEYCPLILTQPFE